MDVLIILGSKSDIKIGKIACDKLESVGISYSLRIASAHRSAAHLESILESSASSAKVIIAAAGMSAHLAGVVASKSLIPVIGIPLEGGLLTGLDALLSTVNMPAGVPVATVSMGEAGAVNAALLAARIIGLTNKTVMTNLENQWKETQAKTIEADRKLKVSSD
ncbi:MAG: 5-(carboxyamino)imidazole ribonucleotide mutase [Nitrospinota bacterium]